MASSLKKVYVLKSNKIKSKKKMNIWKTKKYMRFKLTKNYCGIKNEKPNM